MPEYFRLRMDVLGDVQLSRAFELMAHEAQDLSEPLRQVGEALVSAVGEQFRSEGAHGLGHRWHPLSPAYAAWKRENAPAGPAAPILVFSGDMRSALLDRAAVTVTPRRMVYEPDAPDYAVVHQQGEGHMPQRKIVALAMSDRRGFERIFANWLNGLRRGRLGTR